VFFEGFELFRIDWFGGETLGSRYDLLLDGRQVGRLLDPRKDAEELRIDVVGRPGVQAIELLLFDNKLLVERGSLIEAQT
jgi:hypothetical protein